MIYIKVNIKNGIRTIVATTPFMGFLQIGATEPLAL